MMGCLERQSSNCASGRKLEIGNCWFFPIAHSRLTLPGFPIAGPML